MNSLFPVKFADILLSLEKNKKWQKTLDVFSELLKYPDENYNRHIICSPTVKIALNNKGYNPKHSRYRLAIPKEYDFALKQAVNTRVEVYSVDGDFITSIHQKEWDFELSMALEIELLETLLNINPL